MSRRKKLPYDHCYKAFFETNLANSLHETVLNPSTESSYSEEEWNNLSPDDQALWIETEVHEWMNGLLDSWWEDPTDDENFEPPTVNGYVA